MIELDFSSLNHRNSADIQSLFLLSREAIKKSALPNYHEQLQATNRFLLGALILADPVINAILREVKRISPGIQVGTDEIRKTLQEEVLKREVAQGDRAEEASKQVKKAQTRALRKKSKEAGPDTGQWKLTPLPPAPTLTHRVWVGCEVRAVRADVPRPRMLQEQEPGERSICIGFSLTTFALRYHVALFR